MSEMSKSIAPTTSQKMRAMRGQPRLAWRGPWTGTFRDRSGTARSVTLQRRSSGAGDDFPELMLSLESGEETPIRILEASNRACVMMVGPTSCPTCQCVVVTIIQGVRYGDTLRGEYTTRRVATREIVSEGTFEAHCVDATHRAA